jgi:hypothetical protein
VVVRDTIYTEKLVYVDRVEYVDRTVYKSITQEELQQMLFPISLTNKQVNLMLGKINPAN